ncbi:MAG TPA: hypothetical protein VIH86_11875 [Puia sp.]
MPSSKVNRIYESIIFMIGIAVLIPLIFIITSERESFIAFILQHLQRPYLSNILEQKIITERKFLLLKQAGYVLIFIDAVAIFLLYYYKSKLIDFLNFIFHSVYSAFRSLILVFKTSSKKENIIFGALLAIIILRGLYYIIITDLQYDEMWCYNYYTSRPVYLTVFSYANYPLYELVTHISKWLPFSAKINLRLPVLFAGIFSCIIIYVCTKKITNNFLTALACMLLFAAIPFATQYMLYGKGTGIEIFFAITSFFCLVFFLKEAKNKKYLLLFVIANLFGLYAMPTHIYFWTLQLVFGGFYIWIYRKNLFKIFFVGNVLILVIGFLCYLPMIAGSGIPFFTTSSWDYNDLLDPYSSVSSLIKLINLYFTGNNYGLITALLIAVVVLFVNKKNRKEYLFLLPFAFSLLILPVAIRFVQHIHIPERAVGFIGLIIPISVFCIFFLLKDLVNYYLRAGILIFLFVSMCVVSHFHPFRFWSTKLDKNAISISNLLMQHHVATCYDNATSSKFFYYYPALEFYYAQNKMNIDISMAAKNSQRYKPFSFADNYDCIIDGVSENDSAYLKSYEIIYTDAGAGFKVLMKKGK